MAIIFMNLIEDGVRTGGYEISGITPYVPYINDPQKIDKWTFGSGYTDKGHTYTLCHMLTQPEEQQYATEGHGWCYDNSLRTQSVLKILNKAGICPLELRAQLRKSKIAQMLHKALFDVIEKLSPIMCDNTNDHNLSLYKNNLSVPISESLFPHHNTSIDLKRFTGGLIKFKGDQLINLNEVKNEISYLGTDFSLQKSLRYLGSKIDSCAELEMNITKKEYYRFPNLIGLWGEGPPVVRYLDADSPSLYNGKFDRRCANAAYNVMQRFRMQCECFIEDMDQAKFEKVRDALESKVRPKYCYLTSPMQNAQGERIFRFDIEINTLYNWDKSIIESVKDLLAARNNAANFSVNQDSNHFNLSNATNTTVVDIAADHSGSGNMKLHELINNATTEFATNFLSAGNNATNFPVNQNSSNLNFGHATNTTVVDIAADHSGSGNMKLHELINNATTEFATNFLSAGNNAANFSVNQDSSHFNLSNATNTTVVDIAADHSGSGNMKLHELINNATTEFATNFLSAGNNADQSNLSKPPLSLSQVNGAVYNNIEPSESSDVRTTVIGVTGIVAGAAIVVVAGSFVMSKVKNAVKSWYYNDKNQNVSSGQNHSPTLQSAHNSKQVIPMNFIIKNDSGRLEEFDAVTNSDSEQIPPSKITHVSNSLVNSELQQNVSCA